MSEKEEVMKLTGWDHIYVPSPQETRFAITGHESQVVTVRVPVDDAVQGEPGSMMFLSPGMRQTVSYEGCCKRCCSGESCFVVNYVNSGDGDGFVAMTPNVPTAKVIPVDLSSPHVNGKLVTQQGSYMASYGDVEVGISLDWNCLRCCCGGLGLVRQKVKGSGTVFLGTTGTIVQKVLEEGETILVDTNCVLAFAGSCKLDLKRTGGILGMLGGGEGIFNTTLTGPGLVIVQSMNELVWIEALTAHKIVRR